MILPFWPLIVVLGALVLFVLVAAVRGNHIQVLRNDASAPPPRPAASPEPAAPTDVDPV